MKMKNRIIIINTARASLVDEPAVLETLNYGKTSHYATEVYTNEPSGLNELIIHEKTICTHHIGGYTTKSIDRVIKMTANNIIKEFR